MFLYTFILARESKNIKKKTSLHPLGEEKKG